MIGLKKWVFICLAVAGSAVAQAASTSDAGTADAQAIRARLTTLSKDAFIDDVLARMSVREKIGQLRLISVGGDYPEDRVEREIAEGQIGVVFNTVVRPAIRVFQDASQRSRLGIPVAYAYDVVHGHRTAFPISLGLASTFDRSAVALSARIAAKEASADGLDLSFSPMVDVTREPRWGRTSEGFGEDTYLVSEMGAEMVRAYQKGDTTAPDAIMAVVKHYALYGAVEGGRDYNTVDMSLSRMFQDYLPPYHAAVNAGAGGVMVSLNAVNGVPASASRWLLHDVLRGQWGFTGATFSDHGAILELIRHGVAADHRDAARIALHAGVDLSMNDQIYGPALPGLLASGATAKADLDQAVRHVLAMKYDLGLFHDPYRRLGRPGDAPLDINAESRLHRDEARDVARRSLVLLKNVDRVLPLKAQGTIGVIGPLARSPRDMIGSWSAAALAAQAVTVEQGIVDAVADKNVRVLYARGANVTDDAQIQAFLNLYLPEVDVDPRAPQDMIEEALAVARQSDVIVAVVGESQGMAHEASSRTDIVIPDSQRRLLRALKATGKPLVVVLMNGRPLALGWEHEVADAMLETWFAGTEGGHAIADVLFGKYNPSGKLPMTFPYTVGQVPLYYNHLNTGRPPSGKVPEKYTSRYFDAPNGPLFPFGFGLSYTTFTFSDVSTAAPTWNGQGKLAISVDVTNTGDLPGETVAQLYVRDHVASISRPVKELKRFEKLMLSPQETRKVIFELTTDDLSFYDNDGQRLLESGAFEVQIGPDSQDVKTATFELTGKR